jgi:hypothetical protein
MIVEQIDKEWYARGKRRSVVTRIQLLIIGEDPRTGEP